MERTIDGFDYIAMSEVLRIIDREVEDCRWISTRAETSVARREYWLGGQDALLVLRARLTHDSKR